MQRILVVKEGDSLQVFDVTTDDQLGEVALEIVRGRCASGFYDNPGPFPAFGVSEQVMATYTGCTSLEHLMLKSWERHKQDESGHLVNVRLYKEVHRAAREGDRVAAISFLLSTVGLRSRIPGTCEAHILVLSASYNPLAVVRRVDTASHNETPETTNEHADSA